MKSLKFLSVLMLSSLVPVCITGCQSKFKVQVSVFNGAISEHRDAQDALQLIDSYKSAFHWIGEQSEIYGLDDDEVGGKFVTKMVIGSLLPQYAGDVAKATEAFNKGGESMKGLTELAGSLKEGIKLETARWPKRSERIHVVTNLHHEAIALGEAASRLTKRRSQTGLSEMVVLQARFSEQQARFRKSAQAADAALTEAYSVLRKLSQFPSRQQASGIKVSVENLARMMPAFDRLEQAVDGHMEKTKAAQRLVDYDTSTDLSDPNWRYVAESSEDNWNTIQVLSGDADGEANYVVIQQSMGDFRLKKLFNDPTDAYRAGVKLGKKALETAAKAATAAASGGAMLPIITADAGAGSKGDSSSTAKPAPTAAGSLGVELSKARAELNVLSTDRALALDALNKLIASIDSNKGLALEDVTNRLAEISTMLPIQK